MDAAGTTATSILYATYLFLVRAKKSREFEDEFERHQLKLDTLEMRLDAVRAILEERPEGQTISLAPIFDSAQRTLLRAQQDTAEIGAHTATPLSRMQWVIYRRDRCDRSIADISAVVTGLEGLVSNSRRWQGL
ncbi:uncharacterized protein TrAtP1_003600 [Trichoderma atroviride]|uniref:Prion-inhibition and propagation HeLo domain-containing protein n=1 Tax=Hypocrea atroviridis (strain ATCC 20476 / IMI 206040) TaxID=452589 RepID=G9NWG5_HYPAI|nr:uncharacterized protein TRIATDRAFT_308857 [Trichoderma atroviride IMI 206040]EHK45323.1 hypothetical protein TRIATDRAFT_308857 [Trichoderma atroviride IMI 206040]UKZ62350.1 hypothetical protein TrAtP1_003600 [Trichoderma atroviride]